MQFDDKPPVGKTSQLVKYFSNLGAATNPNSAFKAGSRNLARKITSSRRDPILPQTLPRSRARGWLKIRSFTKDRTKYEGDARGREKLHSSIVDRVNASKIGFQKQIPATYIGDPDTVTTRNLQNVEGVEQHPNDHELRPRPENSVQRYKHNLQQEDSLLSADPGGQTNLVEQLHEMKIEANLATIRYNELFIRYQKHAFKKLEPGLWKPRDDESVKADFDNLARKMKFWSRTFASNMGLLHSTMTEVDHATLLESLQYVVALQTSELPGTLPDRLGHGEGLTVLLNALLAHTIYTEVFRNPFYCLGSEGQFLNNMYHTFLDCK